MKSSKASTKSSDDDDELSTNDFNDMTLYEEFEKSGLSEGRAVDKINIAGQNSVQGFGYSDYNEGLYGGGNKKPGHKKGGKFNIKEYDKIQ